MLNGKTHSKWTFSPAILNYQRITLARGLQNQVGVCSMFAAPIHLEGSLQNDISLLAPLYLVHNFTLDGTNAEHPFYRNLKKRFTRKQLCVCVCVTIIRQDKIFQ